MSKLRLSGTSGRVVAAFAAVYVIWGSTYLAIRFAIETMPPFLMAAARFLIAGALLYAWVRLRGAPRPRLIHWRSALIVGGLLLLAGNGVVSWAEQLVPSGIAALLVAMVPVWMALQNWLRPGGTRPRALVIVGLALGFAGVGLLVFRGGDANGGSINLIGAGAILGASFCWAAGSLYSRRAPMPPVPLLATGMEMLCGGALLLILAVALGEPAQLHLEAVSLRSALALVFLIVFGSLIAFTAYVWLLRTVAPARVSTYAYVNPMVAVFLGWAFAGEQVTGQTLLAAGVIVGAVALIMAARAGEAAHDDGHGAEAAAPSEGEPVLVGSGARE